MACVRWPHHDDGASCHRRNGSRGDPPDGCSPGVQPRAARPARPGGHGRAALPLARQLPRAGQGLAGPAFSGHDLGPAVPGAVRLDRGELVFCALGLSAHGKPLARDPEPGSGPALLPAPRPAHLPRALGPAAHPASVCLPDRTGERITLAAGAGQRLVVVCPHARRHGDLQRGVLDLAPGAVVLSGPAFHDPVLPPHRRLDPVAREPGRHPGLALWHRRPAPQQLQLSPFAALHPQCAARRAVRLRHRFCDQPFRAAPERRRAPAPAAVGGSALPGLSLRAARQERGGLAGRRRAAAVRPGAEPPDRGHDRTDAAAAARLWLAGFAPPSVAGRGEFRRLPLALHGAAPAAQAVSRALGHTRRQRTGLAGLPVDHLAAGRRQLPLDRKTRTRPLCPQSQKNPGARRHMNKHARSLLLLAARPVLFYGAGRAWGWPGLAAAGGGLLMWLLLHFTRLMNIMQRAAKQPIGSVGSAVMLNAKLKPGVTLMHVIAMTRALGERLTPEGEQPEQNRWTDGSHSSVTAHFRNGRLVSWDLARPAPEDETAPAPATGAAP